MKQLDSFLQELSGKVQKYELDLELRSNVETMKRLHPMNGCTLQNLDDDIAYVEAFYSKLKK